MTTRSALNSSPARNFLPWLAAAAALLLAGSLARADDMSLTEATNTTIDLRLGAFALSSVKTSLRLDAPNGSLGSSIDLADKLGANTSLNVFRADASWIISGPHGIDASWYDISLKGVKKIDSSINWGDQVFPVNATISTRFGTNVYKLAYSYTINRDAKHEFTGLIGLHIMQFNASLAANGTAQLERFSATAPLPSFGVAWRARWTERFSTRTSVQYFGISLESGKYSGHLIDALAAAEYRITKTAGLGVGYNRFDLTGAFKPNNLKLSVSYSYNGLLLYAFARF